MTYGDYKNKHKARVIYMVENLREDEFLSKFKEFVKKEKDMGCLDLHPQPINYNKAGVKIDLVYNRLIPQKQDGLYSVYIHPLGGQLMTKNLKSLLYELDKIKNPMIRLAMTEGLLILNLDGNEAKKILSVTKILMEYLN